MRKIVEALSLFLFFFESFLLITWSPYHPSCSYHCTRIWFVNKTLTASANINIATQFQTKHYIKSSTVLVLSLVYTLMCHTTISRYAFNSVGAHFIHRLHRCYFWFSFCVGCCLFFMSNEIWLPWKVVRIGNAVVAEYGFFYRTFFDHCKMVYSMQKCIWYHIFFVILLLRIQYFCFPVLVRILLHSIHCAYGRSCNHKKIIIILLQLPTFFASSIVFQKEGTYGRAHKVNQKKKKTNRKGTLPPPTHTQIEKENENENEITRQCYYYFVARYAVKMCADKICMDFQFSPVHINVPCYHVTIYTYFDLFSFYILMYRNNNQHTKVKASEKKANESRRRRENNTHKHNNRKTTWNNIAIHCFCSAVVVVVFSFLEAIRQKVKCIRTRNEKSKALD